MPLHTITGLCRHIARARAKARLEDEDACERLQMHIGELVDGMTIGQALIAFPPELAARLDAVVGDLIDAAVVAAQGEETPDPKLRRLMDMV